MTLPPTYLAQIVDHVRLATASSEAIALAKLRVMDFIAASCDGLLSDTVGLFDQYVERSGGSHSATVLASGRRSTALLVSAANAAAAHAAETDDIHVDVTGLHAGAVVIPAALAAAEASRSGGRQFLEGVIAGYEVAGRIGAAISPSHRARGFHSTGTIGALGAAAAASIAFGDPNERVVSSIGLGTSMAGGTFSVLAGGAQAKHLHPAHAAMAGTWAADLARLGLDAAPGALEVVDGFFSAYSDQVDRDRLLGATSEFEIARVLVKPFPCCAHAYGAVEAALSLRDQTHLDSIETIRVQTYHAAAVLANRHPSTREEAKLSLPYCVMAALREPVFDESCFSDEAIKRITADPLLNRLIMEDSDWANAAFPKKRLTRLGLTRVTGEGVASEKEILHRPTTEPSVIHRKFRVACTPVFGAAVEELSNRIQELDSTSNAVVELVSFCSKAASDYRSGSRFI